MYFLNNNEAFLVSLVILVVRAFDSPLRSDFHLRAVSPDRDIVLEHSRDC